MVHQARFRETLAESGQLAFFPDPTAKPAEAVYGILTYTRSIWPAGDSQKWGHLPGSAHLAFPDADLKKYVHSIDLFQRYADVVKANTPQEWDEPTLLRFIERGRRLAA